MARFAGTALATAVVVAAGLALLAGVLMPRLAGATPYTVETGSMSPTYPPGTLVVVRPAAVVRTGDVITFQERSGEPEVVTHRVVAEAVTLGGETRYTTKGDANPVADVDPVRPEQVRGVVWYAVPYLGYVSALFSGTQRRWVSTLVALALAGYAAWQVVQARRERGRRTRRHRAARRGATSRGVHDEAGAIRLAGVLVAGTVTGALAVLVGVASPAAADEDGLQLSVDGVTWSDDPTQPLLDPALVWVPGDVEQGVLYARTTCQAGTGDAVVTPDAGGDGAPLLADLDVATSVDGGAWAAGLASPGFAVTAAHVTTVAVRVAFDPAATNPSQLRQVALAVTVTVACDEPGPSSSPSAPPTAEPVVTPPANAERGDGTLATTGSDVLRATAAATVLVLAGAWLVTASRGPRRGEQGRSRRD